MIITDSYTTFPLHRRWSFEHRKHLFGLHFSLFYYKLTALKSSLSKTSFDTLAILLLLWSS